MAFHTSESMMQPFVDPWHKPDKLNVAEEEPVADEVVTPADSLVAAVAAFGLLAVLA